MKEIMLNQIENEKQIYFLKLIVATDNITFIESNSLNTIDETKNRYSNINISKKDIALIKYDKNNTNIKPKKKNNFVCLLIGLVSIACSLPFLTMKNYSNIAITILIIGAVLFLIGLIPFQQNGEEIEKTGNFQILNNSNNILYSKSIILDNDKIEEIITAINNIY